MVTAHNALELTGQKFNRWTVLRRAGTEDRKSTWLCKCDCGTVRVVKGYTLKHGYSKSCGCFERELHVKRLTVHGKSNTRLFRIWQAMKTRCYNPNSEDFKWYGGRGIQVCDEWLQDFQNFYKWAIANGYRDDLTIDRIEVNGNYEPKNCRWVSQKVQCSNTRNNLIICFRGQEKTLKEWCDELGLRYGTVHSRLNSYGWSVEKALMTPIKGSSVC